MRPMDVIQRALSTVSRKRRPVHALPGSQGGDVTGGRARRWRPSCARACGARSASTTAAARSTPPTARTTARCRSASSIPRDVDDVVETVARLPRVRRAAALARRRHQPRRAVLQRRGGHGLVEVHAPRARDRPRRARLARVQPGIVLDDLRDAAETHHLTFAPDPATHTHCTLGGMIGNNSCGVHSLMAGPHDLDNVEELDILTYDGLRLRVGPDDRGGAASASSARAAGAGEIYAGCAALRDRYARRHPPPLSRRSPRRVSGYNLDELLPENGFHVARALVGTEGTCVTVLEATLRLVPSPPAAVAAGARLPRRLRGRPTTSPRS